jgi:hypothetical protein
MKRIVSFITASLILLGAATTVSADGPGKITGMAHNLSYGYAGDPYLGEISPQDGLVEYIELTDDMFTWDEEYIPEDEPAPLTSAQIRAAGITVRASNSRVLDSVTVNRQKSRIEVKFMEEFVEVKEQDFEFDVILSIDGRQQRDYAMNFSGTFGNTVMSVDSSVDYADISEGDVIEAMDYVSTIDLDLGDGVQLATRLTEGRMYYGTARLVPYGDGDDFMDEHPSVEEAIILKTVGLSGSASTATLGEGLGSYFVYSETGEYLGRGNDKLAYSDVYYLSSAKLEIAVDNEQGNVDEPTDPVNNAEPTNPTNNAPGTTPGGSMPLAPTNANNIPGTGR